MERDNDSANGVASHESETSGDATTADATTSDATTTDSTAADDARPSADGTLLNIELQASPTLPPPPLPPAVLAPAPPFIAEREDDLWGPFELDIAVHPAAAVSDRLLRVGREVSVRQPDGSVRPIELAEAKRVCSKIKKRGAHPSSSSSSTRLSQAETLTGPPSHAYGGGDVSSQRTRLRLVGALAGREEEVTTEDMLRARKRAGGGKALDSATVKGVCHNDETMESALRAGDVEVAVFLELESRGLVKEGRIQTEVSSEEIDKSHKRLARSAGLGPVRKPDAAGVLACFRRFEETGDATGEHKLNDYVLGK